MYKIFHIDFNFVTLKKDYLIKLLHTLADYGYNAILWELENKVKLSACPECSPPDALSQDDFREILALSRELGLEPIPLLQTVGHAEYVLMQEPYHKFRENPLRHDCYCTSNMEVRKFLKSLVHEYLELFGEIKIFHLGGDEAYEFGTCPICREYCDQHGRNKLYAEHLLDIAQEIRARNIRPGIWLDTIMRYPQELDTIPRDFTIWDWNYVRHDVTDATYVLCWGHGGIDLDKLPGHPMLEIFPEMLKGDKCDPFYTADFLVRQGYDVILCSASRSASNSPFCGRHSLHGPNIYSSSKITAERKLLGFCVTSWAIRLNPYETQLPHIALATIAADNPKLSYEEALEQVCQKLFNSNQPDFFNAIAEVGEEFFFCETLQMGIQWNRLKDGTMPPPSRIPELIATEKEKHPEAWANLPATLKLRSEKIRAGLEILYRIFEELNFTGAPGLEVIASWLAAGNLQILQNAIANAVMRRANGESVNAEEMRKIADLGKNLFIAQRPGETQLSAHWNAELVYEPLQQYILGK